jgi:hypothetical protein
VEIVFLILGLIERTVKLAPEVVKLINRLRSGEEITKEEIERTEALVKGAVDRWNAAGGENPDKETP